MSHPAQDEFHRLHTAYLKLRAAVRDPITGLTHYALAFDAIRGLTADRQRIGVWWVALGGRRMIEAIYGWEAYDRVLAIVAKTLDEAREDLIAPDTIIGSTGIHADAFALFLRGARDGQQFETASLRFEAAELETRIEQRLRQAEVGELPGGARVRVGTALLADNPYHRFERLVYAALEQARELTDQPRETEWLAWHAEFQRVLRDNDVRAVFQPVFDLESGRLEGLEAFSRGPEKSVFFYPRVLISAGRDYGEAERVDRLCRHRAFDALAGLAPPARLFLNTTTASLADPDWASPETQAALERAGLTPATVVLELTESALGDCPDRYRAEIDALRRLGYRFSLDDVGSSAHTSVVIDALRPEFLKLDLTVLRGIEGDQGRRELVRDLARLASRAGATLIAERLESDDERRTMLECGARWGQGYLFAPEAPASARRSAVGHEGA